MTEKAPDGGLPFHILWVSLDMSHKKSMFIKLHCSELFATYHQNNNYYGVIIQFIVDQ
jgi:hypothetical protein